MTSGAGRRPGIDRVHEAVSSGQLWRAKEILAGRIGSGPFDPESCEQLGRVLLQMGDDLDAGRFLFLSGQRHAEYEPAIQLFLRRYSRAGWQSLVAAFPAAARRCTWSELPPRVREDLVAAGVPERSDTEPLRATLRHHPAGGSGWGGCLVPLAILALMGALLWVAIGYL